MWDDAEKFLSKDKYIAPLIKKYGTCKYKKRPKKVYFKSLVSAIVGQQLSVKAAASIFKKLDTELDGEVLPEKILGKRDATLRKCGLSFSKINYIKDLAQKVRDGEVEIYKFDKLTDEKVRDELITVKGIGKWTTDMFLMFTLARPDIFPVEDLGIRNGIKRLIGSEMSSDEMTDFAKRWEPYRSIASWYIWELLDNK
jgi:DNA-3-methyladenine glycosylase II